MTTRKPEKHPRRRGEDQGRAGLCAEGGRNTPAGAGKTWDAKNRVGLPEKHPRRRGEDIYAKEIQEIAQETPPQARGRLRGLFLSGVWKDF